MIAEGDSLLETRMALCDLLMGRILRSHALAELMIALLCDATMRHDEATERLDYAAHWEWLAVRVEWGQIAFGGRVNRCGLAEESAPSAASML